MARLMAAVVLAGAAGWAAATAQTDGAADAAKKLEGNYSVVSMTRGGKAADKKTDGVVFAFKGGSIVITEGGRKEDTAEFKLDPTKTPPHIDIFPARKSGEKIQGVYQTKTTPDGLELTVVFAKDGGDRPADFKGEGSDTVVLKLLRKSAK
jgi:uncharacterized protein (TIGR03067 family)